MKRTALLFLVAAFLIAGPDADAAKINKPDLVCNALSVQKVETKEVPLRVRVHLEVHNKGGGSNPQYKARLVYRKGTSGPWTTHKEFPLPPSPAGGGAIWNEQVDLSDGGTYTFKVEVDFENQVSESNEGNNSRSVTKTFPAGTPDLVVENVSAEVTNRSNTGDVSGKVTWDLRNTGDGRADGSFVTVVKVSKNGGPFADLARKTSANLAAGDSQHFSENFRFASVKKLKFRVEADATRKVRERSESNNKADSNEVQP